MNKKLILEKIRVLKKDYETKNLIYHPTTFWKNISDNFTEIFKKKGLKNFRNYVCKNFFVPTYNFFW